MDGGKHPSKCKWFDLSIFANFMFALIVLSSITTKGERCSQEGKIFSKVRNADWIKSTYERRVENRVMNKGDHGFRGRPNRIWMMVSIQASVSG